MINRRDAETQSFKEITDQAIGACIEIHKCVGPGLLHDAQLLTYLKLSNLSLGLLINFNVPVLKNGIKRIANNFNETPFTQRPPAELTAFSL